MTEHTLARPATTSALDRYLSAETRLWRHHRLMPRERFIGLERPRARLRVLESGSGRPVLFVHGTIGPGGWPSLIAELPGVRAIALDRPGWGLSTPIAFPRTGYRAFVADLLAESLDALALDAVDVVGGSIGNLWALALAERHPDRVRRMVLLGGGPLDRAVTVPPFIKFVTSPLGAIVVRLRVSPKRVRGILEGSGHGPSLAAGRIPQELVDWRVALHNDTPSMRHERSMSQAVVAGSGWRPGIAFEPADLSTIDAPTCMVFGTADPTGNEQIWRRFMSALPNGELLVVPDAGHMVWFDDPAGVGARVGGFLSA